jgi:hypothetical protein
MTGKKHPEDTEGCRLPEVLKYLWVYFWDLNCGRPVWQGGFRPLPATEIHAWEQINQIKLETWELAALRQLDALFLKIYTEA